MAEPIDRDARIAPTAHYTAYVWHRLGLPHAHLFATPTGMRLFWSFRLAGEWLFAAHPTLPSMVQYLELRHRAIEHALDEHAPDFIVELGAGLSRRGLTWSADRAVRYLEVDLPHMIEMKRAIIRERADPDVRRRAEQRLAHAAVDVLGPEFGAWLAKALAGAERPAVVAEGLLGYFDVNERSRLASSIACALSAHAGRGVFICDLRAREGGRSVAVAARVLRSAIWIATRGRGARAEFEGRSAVEAFFRQAGFLSAAPVPVEGIAPHLTRLRSPAKVWRAEV